MLKIVRTKIVATIGPACSDTKTIELLIKNGVDVFRLNFSHGDFEQHKEYIKSVRKAAQNFGEEIAILADLPGPKIRLGKIEPKPVVISKGQDVILSTTKAKPSDRIFPLEYKSLTKYVKAGETVTINDGQILLSIEGVHGDEIICKVLEGGEISSRKGINLPKTHLPIPALTEKDKEIIRFAIKEKVDWFALSFVSKPEDIIQCRKYIKSLGSDIPIVAKLEKHEVFNSLDKIIEVSDAVMVARGDLGVEIPIEEVPIRQKEIIARCNHFGKPVITATQMLESMINSYRPTRAEVTDVANAIYDGTDAVMLSGETSVGKYPVKAAAMMNTIGQTVQAEFEKNGDDPCQKLEWDIPLSTASAAVNLANNIKAGAIVCFTSSGSTPLRVSRFRPKCPIISYSTNIPTQRKCVLYWGVLSKEIPGDFFRKDSDKALAELIEWVKTDLKKSRIVKPGDSIIVVAGVPLSESGITNMIRVANI